MEKKKGLSLQTILTIAGIALIYVLAFLLDRIPGVPIMLTTVLRKGAIYSLVAVSMNLLNGFTGLFSLGQAGFMLLGAYAYAVLCIPVAKRAGVYQYFDGGAIHFSIPEIFSGVLGETVGTTVGMLAALLVQALRKSSLLYDAMEARCYDGRIRVLYESGRAEKKEIAAVVLYLAALLVLAVICWQKGGL